MGKGRRCWLTDSILVTVDSLFNADEGVWVTSVQQDTLFHLVCAEEFKTAATSSTSKDNGCKRPKLEGNVGLPKT